jgi:hypothetical protein
LNNRPASAQATSGVDTANLARTDDFLFPSRRQRSWSAHERLSIVRAVLLNVFVEELRAIGAPVDRGLESAGLSSDIEAEPDADLCLRSCAKLFAEASPVGSVFQPKFGNCEGNGDRP